MHPLIQKRESSFFGFWIKYWRVSFVVMALILLLGISSLINIPKESSPQIKFGIIQVTTPYLGANPVDIDRLITKEIEQAVDNLEGIKRYTSSSRNSFSSTIIELENEVDTDLFINKLRTAIANVSLPEGAEDPTVTELSIESDRMFNLLLYAPADLYDVSALKDLAVELKDRLIGVSGVGNITINGGEDYEFQFLVDELTARSFGLTPAQIAQQIRSSQLNIPLGSYIISDLIYDFRIQADKEDIYSLLDLPINTPAGVTIPLEQLGTFERKEKNDTEEFLGVPDLPNQRLVSLTFYKTSSSNIFSAASNAKEEISALLDDPLYADISYGFTLDLSEIIKDDYANLSNSALQTIVLVFLTMLFFVGRKPSLIASIGLPMGFMITFIALDTFGYTLNFLTNFSLVLTLGIAIDTTIVIIEASAERMKLGYNPKTAILFAVKDFKNSIIAGTMTTIVVFIPMMVLPGVTGKFLAYIPITVFSTLLAVLFLALTLNSALYYKLSKKGSTYLANPGTEKFLTQEERDILEQERKGKTEQKESRGRRERFLESIGTKYQQGLSSVLGNQKKRRLSIFLPLIGVVLTFIFLAPRIGFTFFPSGDNGSFTINIASTPGTTKQKMLDLLPFIEPQLQGRPELKQYTITAQNNSLEIAIDLTDKKDRTRLDQRNVFDVEEDLLEDIAFLTQEGYIITSAVQAGGPPQGRPVGIKITATSAEQFSDMIALGKDIEHYLKGVAGTKNAGISSPDTPGQFVVTFDLNKLSSVGITQAQAASELSQAINGIQAGTISVQGQDKTIKVLYRQFVDGVTPEQIGQLTLMNARGQEIRVGDLMMIQPDASVDQITRENGKVSIRVESDLEDGFTTQGTQIQSALLEYAQTLQVPTGIIIEPVGESEENREILLATARGFAISLACIFIILLLMFNSFTKPAIILFTIILALLGVNIGLFITKNPYSMTFFIGFIALAGIVVNDAIIFLDRIRENIHHRIDEVTAIIEAGKSRLQPIMLTTITTVLGILPLSLQDEFWAGLGFTIIFGLFAGSTMTLFVIPNLYYELLVEKKITWVKIAFWTILFFPIGIGLLIKRIRQKSPSLDTATAEVVS